MSKRSRNEEERRQYRYNRQWWDDWPHGTVCPTCKSTNYGGNGITIKKHRTTRKGIGLRVYGLIRTRTHNGSHKGGHTGRTYVRCPDKFHTRTVKSEPTPEPPPIPVAKPKSNRDVKHKMRQAKDRR